MDLSRREKIGLTAFIFIIITLISIMYFNNSGKKDIEVISKKGTSAAEGNTASKKDIVVYIQGEVKKPGVYTLKEGERIGKLIELAGGVTDKADIFVVNYAKKLSDEEFVRIPEKKLSSSNVIGNMKNDKDIYSNINDKININTADLEQLKSLPRIGDKTAQKIIEYRESNGPFKDVKDITNVSGIGDKMFESIKDKITVY